MLYDLYTYKGGEVVKRYRCECRSRGLPNSPVSVDVIEARNYFDAVSKITEKAGETMVVLSVKMIRKENDDAVRRVSEGNLQSDS